MIDGHCHLDRRIGNCTEALRYLYSEATSAGIKKIILLNIPELAFDNNQVLENTEKYRGFFFVFPSLNPYSDSACDELEQLKASGASGLKLHPRLHGYRIDSDECADLLECAQELKMPVMIDCFPDGRNLSLGNTPDVFARVADRAPNLRIAIGHAGGHKILDALMVAKYFKNVYLDLSYTLLYYRNSAVTKNISYVIESIKAERIFWGSDYPDRPYRETVDLSLKEFGRIVLSEDIRKSVLETNAENFLGNIS
jgi:predicted TIM-barrel fold metal-dependent hydrolase